MPILPRSRAAALAALILVMFAGWAGPASAAASCQVEPSFGPYYHLELTVPAAFCKTVKDDPSCAAFPKPSAIQLHGLWVDYARGRGGVRWPSGSCDAAGCELLDGKGVDFCQALPDMPDIYQSTAWQSGKGYFAGTEKCLERHEWVKHGTCSPMAPAAWAEWSLTKTAEIATKLAAPLDRPIVQGQFDALVRANLPELDGAIHARCNGGALVSFSVDYEWGATPGAVRKTASGRNEFTGCGSAFTIPTRP